MSDHPSAGPAHDPQRLRRAAMRFGLLVVLLAGSFAAMRWTPLGEYLEAERLRATLAHLRGAWWSPFVHVGLCVTLGAVGVPATPFLLAGAAIFGSVWGTLWNWLGIVCASIAGFWLAKALGREFVERVGGEKVRRAESAFHRGGFLPLVAVRFLPIPFSLVNAAAAVVGVRFTKFVAATAIGVTPPVAILTYFAAALLEAATGERSAIATQMLIFFFAAAVLVFLPIGIRRRLRRRRLRELRGARAERESQNGAAGAAAD